jgi:peptide deformylase
VTVQPLRLLGDPVLRTACDPVTRFDDATGRLVDDLLETVLLPGRAGLAAPQIGRRMWAAAMLVNSAGLIRLSYFAFGPRRPAA